MLLREQEIKITSKVFCKTAKIQVFQHIMIPSKLPQAKLSSFSTRFRVHSLFCTLSHRLHPLLRGEIQFTSRASSRLGDVKKLLFFLLLFVWDTMAGSSSRQQPSVCVTTSQLCPHLNLLHIKSDLKLLFLVHQQTTTTNVRHLCALHEDLSAPWRWAELAAAAFFFCLSVDDVVAIGSFCTILHGARRRESARLHCWELKAPKKVCVCIWQQHSQQHYRLIPTPPSLHQH